MHCSDFSPPPHGGRLRAAAHDYRIPLRHWLDLSTGINPVGWPVPAVPPEVWQRLPEDDDDLCMAMRAYFRSAPCLPVAGSQAAIQTLPRLRPASRIGVVSPTYAEHAQGWRIAGHEVVLLPHDAVDATLNDLDVLVVVNPNNPTGFVTPRDTLLRWHARLAARGGGLIMDEAFIDGTPELSIADQATQRGLIVLRSMGKFWGLAGIRAGFVLAAPDLLAQLRTQIGPWGMSHPARWITQRALADRVWQHETATRLHIDSARLSDLLAANGLPSPSGATLFRWVPHAQPRVLFDALAKRGVLVRAFDEGLRFGLPRSEEGWGKLVAVLGEVMR